MSVNNPIVQQFITNITNQTFTDAKMAGAQWEYQGSIGAPCENGKFQTNSPDTAATTRIHLSTVNTAGTNSEYILNIGVTNFIRFTDVNGKTVVFLITQMTPAEDSMCIDIGVQIEGGETPWAGRYVVDFQPGTGA